MISSPSHLLKRAAIAQLCSGSSKMKNLLDIAKCAGWARREGASMLFLPEGLGFLGNNAEETVLNAEPELMTLQHSHSTTDSLEVWWCKMLAQTFHTHATESLSSSMTDMSSNLSSSSDVDHHTFASCIELIQNKNISIIRGLQTIAKESGLWISGGGIHIQEEPNVDSKVNQSARVFNTHIIMNHEGDIVASYRKIHLFEVSIPAQNLRFKESSYTAPGNKIVVCSSPIGMLGLSTCFDVRFPELYHELRNAGADILLVPSAFTVPTGQAHWHTLLKGK